MQPIKRKPFVPSELTLTKKLQSQLPFDLKPKLQVERVSRKRPAVVERSTAVVLEPHEAKVRKVVSILEKVHAARTEKERQDLERRQADFKKVGISFFPFLTSTHSGFRSRRRWSGRSATR